MARKTLRAPLVLSNKSRKLLTELSGSMTAPTREVVRAKVLLHYANGAAISSIKRYIGISRPAIYKCIDKALAAGAQSGLKDTYHSSKEPEILDDAKTWVVNLVCSKPKDHGLAAELWTLSALAHYLANHAAEAGFPRLTSAVKATVWRIRERSLPTLSQGIEVVSLLICSNALTRTIRLKRSSGWCWITTLRTFQRKL